MHTTDDQTLQTQCCARCDTAYAREAFGAGYGCATYANDPQNPTNLHGSYGSVEHDMTTYLVAKPKHLPKGVVYCDACVSVLADQGVLVEETSPPLQTHFYPDGMTKEEFLEKYTEIS